MTDSLPISRRGLLLGLTAALGLRILPGLADEKPPSDRGIGGTGITGAPDASQSIGFLGSIQRFGSIYVNGDRIAYADTVAVTIDGRRRRPGDMRIGQVVKTVAQRRGGRLSTDRIDILSEVVGPVEALEGESMIVLGQRVHLGTTGSGDFTLGQRVAVSGFRRPDQSIAARLVEPAGSRPDQVVGLATFRGWTLKIAGLELFGPDARFDGHRVVVRGRRTARGLMVKSIALDGLPGGVGLNALSIEAYVTRHGNEMQLGSGIVLNDASGHIEANGGDQPSFVTINLGSASGHVGPMGAGRDGGLPSQRPQSPTGAPVSPPTGVAPGSGPSSPGAPASFGFGPDAAASAAIRISPGGNGRPGPGSGGP